MYLLIICLIILSILYLLYRNNQYNKILESFDNTQSSLSTMYESENYYESFLSKFIGLFTKFNSIIGPIDSNTYLPGDLVNPNTSLNKWDGVWKTSTTNGIYSNIFQINNRLIISLSLYHNTYQNSEIIDNLSTSGECSPNYFIGIGTLNDNQTSFLINKSDVKCDNFFYTDAERVVSLSGQMLFNDNVRTINMTMTLKNIQYSTTYSVDIIFNFDRIYTKYDNYKASVSLPYIPESEFYLEEVICQTPGESPCQYTDYGLANTVYSEDLDGNDYNACGAIISDINIVNKCDPNNTSCVFSSPSPSDVSNGSIPIGTCPNIVRNISDYMNFTPLNILTKNVDNSMYICNYLQYLNSCNSCILCYVTNIGNAYTLNYQFFGTLPGENSLTVQADMMDQMLNNPNAQVNTISLLSYYRNILNTKTNLPEIPKGVSFINYPQSYSMADATNLCNTYIKQYYGPIGNNAYSPALWTVNAGNKIDVNNLCTFNLSTSSNYNLPVKYVNCNKNGTVSLSLFKGGDEQELTLDNYLIVKSKKNLVSNRTDAVAITANIKTSNGLYLVPSMDVSGFSNNSNLLTTNIFPSKNGKWLILGLTVNNMNNLKNILQNLSFDYI